MSLVAPPEFRRLGFGPGDAADPAAGGGGGFFVPVPGASDDAGPADAFRETLDVLTLLAADVCDVGGGGIGSNFFPSSWSPETGDITAANLRFHGGERECDGHRSSFAAAPSTARKRPPPAAAPAPAVPLWAGSGASGDTSARARGKVPQPPAPESAPTTATAATLALRSSGSLRLAGRPKPMSPAAAGGAAATATGSATAAFHSRRRVTVRMTRATVARLLDAAFGVRSHADLASFATVLRDFLPWARLRVALGLHVARDAAVRSAVRRVFDSVADFYAGAAAAGGAAGDETGGAAGVAAGSASGPDDAAAAAFGVRPGLGCPASPAASARFSRRFPRAADAAGSPRKPRLARADESSEGWTRACAVRRAAAPPALAPQNGSGLAASGAGITGASGAAFSAVAETARSAAGSIAGTSGALSCANFGSTAGRGSATHAAVAAAAGAGGGGVAGGPAAPASRHGEAAGGESGAVRFPGPPRQPPLWSAAALLLLLGKFAMGANAAAAAALAMKPALAASAARFCIETMAHFAENACRVGGHFAGSSGAGGFGGESVRGEAAQAGGNCSKDCGEDTGGAGVDAGSAAGAAGAAAADVSAGAAAGASAPADGPASAPGGGGSSGSGKSGSGSGPLNSSDGRASTSSPLNSSRIERLRGCDGRGRGRGPSEDGFWRDPGSRGSGSAGAAAAPFGEHAASGGYGVAGFSGADAAATAELFSLLCRGLDWFCLGGISVAVAGIPQLPQKLTPIFLYLAAVPVADPPRWVREAGSLLQLLHAFDGTLAAGVAGGPAALRALLRLLVRAAEVAADAKSAGSGRFAAALAGGSGHSNGLQGVDTNPGASTSFFRLRRMRNRTPHSASAGFNPSSRTGSITSLASSAIGASAGAAAPDPSFAGTRSSFMCPHLGPGSALLNLLTDEHEAEWDSEKRAEALTGRGFFVPGNPGAGASGARGGAQLPSRSGERRTLGRWWNRWRRRRQRRRSSAAESGNCDDAAGAGASVGLQRCPSLLPAHEFRDDRFGALTCHSWCQPCGGSFWRGGSAGMVYGGSGRRCPATFFSRGSRASIIDETTAPAAGGGSGAPVGGGARRFPTGLVSSGVFDAGSNVLDESYILAGGNGGGDAGGGGGKSFAHCTTYPVSQAAAPGSPRLRQSSFLATAVSALRSGRRRRQAAVPAATGPGAAAGRAASPEARLKTSFEALSRVPAAVHTPWDIDYYLPFIFVSLCRQGLGDILGKGAAGGAGLASAGAAGAGAGAGRSRAGSSASGPRGGSACGPATAVSEETTKDDDGSAERIVGHSGSSATGGAAASIGAAASTGAATATGGAAAAMTVAGKVPGAGAAVDSATILYSSSPDAYFTTLIHYLSTTHKWLIPCTGLGSSRDSPGSPRRLAAALRDNPHSFLPTALSGNSGFDALARAGSGAPRRLPLVARWYAAASRCADCGAGVAGGAGGAGDASARRFGRRPTAAGGAVARKLRAAACAWREAAGVPAAGAAGGPSAATAAGFPPSPPHSCPDCHCVVYCSETCARNNAELHGYFCPVRPDLASPRSTGGTWSA